MEPELRDAPDPATLPHCPGLELKPIALDSLNPFCAWASSKNFLCSPGLRERHAEKVRLEWPWAEVQTGELGSIMPGVPGSAAQGSPLWS